MSHALSMFCRRLLGRLVLVLAFGTVMVSSVTATTLTSPGGSSVTWDLSGGTITWSYSFHFTSGVSYGGGWIWTTTGNGGPYGSAKFDAASGSAGHATSATGSFSVSAGDWFRIGIRDSNFSNVPIYQSEVYFQVPAADEKIRFNVTNTKDYPVKYVVTDRATGSVIASYEAASGTVNHVWVVTVTGYDGPYDLSMFVPSHLVDGVWEESDLTDGDELPVTDDVPSTTVTAPNDPSPDDAQPAEPPPTAPSGSGSVSTTIWKTTTTGTVDNERLDKATYKQGVDKVVATLKPMDDSLKKLVAHDDAEDAAKEEAQTTAASVQTEAASQGSSASTAVRSLYDAVGTNSQGFTVSPSGAAPAALTVAMPAAFGGKTFSMNPFTSDRLGPLASWFRTAVSWLAVVILGAWLWSRVAEWTRGFSAMRQASGNAVVGGTGAQATSLAAAGLMTVAVVVAVTALLAWSFADISFPALVTVMHSNPVTSMPADVFWFVDQLFPVATLISCLCARLTFNMYASSVFAGCSAVVRFIVP